MSNIIKKILSILLITFSTIITGVVESEKVMANEEALLKGPIKILCGYPGCPGHLPGEPYCVPPIPKKMYFNSYNYKDDIDTRKDIDNIIGYFESKNYTIINEVNSSFENMKSYEDEYSLMNRKYYFISSHGSEDGHVFFNKHSYSLANEFPFMGNVDIALFSICYGGKEGNAAEIVVNQKSASNGIGWPGLTYVKSSRTFTTRFWKLVIKDNQSVEKAIEKSLKHTQKTYFYNFGIWGDNTIMDPRLYSHNTTYNLKEAPHYTENIFNEEIMIDHNDEILYFKKYGDVYTNNYKVVKKSNNETLKEYDQNLLIKSKNHMREKRKNTLQNTFKKNILDEYVKNEYSGNYSYETTLEQNYLLNNTNGKLVEIKRIQVIINDSILDEIYIDQTNMKLIEEKDMLEYFNINNMRR